MFERLAGHGGDRERYVRQRLVAAGGGDDDIIGILRATFVLDDFVDRRRFLGGDGLADRGHRLLRERWRSPRRHACRDQPVRLAHFTLSPIFLIYVCVKPSTKTQATHTKKPQLHYG